MDRNQVIGFVLIFLILVVWSIINQPTAEEIEQAKAEEAVRIAQQEEAVRTETSTPAFTPTADTIVSQAQSDLTPKPIQIPEQTSTLSNDLITLSFSSKGGRLTGSALSDYDKIVISDEGRTKTPVELFEDNKNRFNFKLPFRNRTINTDNLDFSPQITGSTLTYRANTNEGGYIEQRYTLKEDSYRIDYSVRFVGVQNEIIPGQKITLEIDNYLDPIEENVQFEKTYSTVYFKEVEDDSENCSCRGNDTKDRENTKIEWTSFANQFFNTTLVARSAPFDGLVATTEMLGDQTEDLKKTTALMNIPFNGSSDEAFDMEMYIGPNEYRRLRAFDNDLEEIIPFGRSIFGDINRLFIRPFFDWLSQFIGSKGMVIIVLIFIIKMALYPLTYKMLHSQAKMGALKPQLAGLKSKFKDDAQKVQMETMKVYREYGVSPFGGCFPMIAQIPIWYALFRFFPASITFRQEAFLWAHDLSSYDVFVNLPFHIPTFGAHLSLFTILWAVTQVIYTYYNSMHMDMSANPAMKYVQYLMPIMFLAFFNSYASGLTCYMLFSTIFNIAQTVVTKKFVFDEEKILAELNIQKAKPKKKNSFQARLEEAMKRQQEVQRQKELQKKKKKT